MNVQLRNEITGGIYAVQRQWVVTNASTLITKRLSTIAHTAAVHGSRAIIITSTHAVFLRVNDWVNVTFSTNSALNGRYRITAATTTTFTIAVKDTVADAGDVDSDILTLYANLPFTAATFHGQKQATIDNTGDVYFGTISPLHPDKLQPGGERLVAPTVGRWWDLADWSLTVITANDGLVITFD